MKKRNSPSYVHVLLKTSRSIRELSFFTSSYYYSRWCIFRVVSRLPGFLFDDVLVAVTHGLLGSPVRCETKITKNWPRLSRIKPRQLTSARSQEWKNVQVYIQLCRRIVHMCEKKDKLLPTTTLSETQFTDISWRWKTTDAMFSCNLWDNEMHKDWDLFVIHKSFILKKIFC